MDKKLTKHGNSLALIIDKPLLKLLKMNKETTVRISITGDSLVITPTKNKKVTVSKKSKNSIKTIVKRIAKTHRETFKKLAKT